MGSTATAKPLRLGIIGCGGISERHARGAASSEDVTIVACCDLRSPVADAWAVRYGCERSYGDYLTTVREHDLEDAVLVATWPTQHREHVLGCLDAGVQRILCEKTLALNGAEALKIWSAARTSGALVVEALAAASGDGRGRALGSRLLLRRRVQPARGSSTGRGASHRRDERRLPHRRPG